MDAKKFLDEFKHIASAPNGVQQLRQMIYSLAITGDLTQQLAIDGDAKSLLNDIEKTKTRLIQEKIFKHSSKLENKPTVIPNIIKIKLPSSWCWSRLVDIGEINPRNELADDSLTSFIPMSEIPQCYSNKIESEPRLWREIKKGFTHFVDGDVVLAKITPCFENGKAAVINGLINGVGAGTTELHVIRVISEFIQPRYVYIFLRSPYFMIEGEKNMTGTAGQKRLPTEYFATHPFPLPPFEEQKRIVAKVDELMALCDKLEAQERERESLGKLTRQVIFNILSKTNELDKIKKSWQYFYQNNKVLFDSSEAITVLRELILDLAIKGRLKGSVNEELPNLISMYHKTIQDDYSEQSSKLDSIDSSEIDNLFPRNWIPMKLGSIVSKLGAGSTPKGGREIYSKQGYKFLRSQNIWNDGLHLEDVAYITEEIHNKMSSTKVESGDILLNITGASIGRVAIVPDKWDTANVSQHVAIIRLIDKELKEFVHLWLTSPTIQTQIRSVQVGISREGLSMKKLSNFVIYFPPSEERTIILKKVNKLNKLCDLLNQQIDLAQKTAKLLALSFVSTITGIQSKEKEKMKTPKTEIVSNLRIGKANPTNKEQAPLTTILIKHKGELSAKSLWSNSGLEIDAFYQQLKTEMAKGWIVQPEVAYMKEVEVN